jgi:competence protein ComEC
MINLQRSVRLLIVVGFIVSATTACTTKPEELDIYFVDVEGGQATLIVMPDGESLLIDAGYPGDGDDARDAQRIMAAAKDAGVTTIDYLLITHFHGDHFGGTVALSQLTTIGTFIDHESPAQEALATPEAIERFAAYQRVRGTANHVVPSVGDRLPLRGIEAVVVSSDGSTLAEPMARAGTINSACDRDVLAPVDLFENPRSTGVLVQFGEFRFLDIGDLSGQPLSDLVCPVDRIGPVDVYLVPHHGGADVADMATLTAFQPRVAIINNGTVKGGEAAMFDLLGAADLDDVWQLHRSENEGAENFSDEQIANFDEETAYWIKLTANRNGSFQIQNGRTGLMKDYR